MLPPHLFLALGAPATSCGAASCANAFTTFFATPLGGVVQTVLRTLGVIFVLLTIFAVVVEVRKGKIGPAFKLGIGAFAFEVFLLDPALIGLLVSVVVYVVGLVISTFMTLVGG